MAVASSLVLGVFSYNNIAYSIKNNTNKSTNNTLLQIDNNLNILLRSYEDVLYQIYTDDDVISWVDSISAGEDTAVEKNKLRRYLRALVNSKDYIRSITVVTSSGEVVAYDQMTNKTYENGWFENYSMPQELLYAEISKNALLHIFNPEYGTTFANEDYYLLHLGHRFVDYKDIRRDVGVVILSIDETMLEQCCLTDEENDDFIFITDDEGKIISCGNKRNYIGKTLETENLKDYNAFLSQDLGMSGKYDIYSYHDDALGWNIIYADDTAGMASTLRRQLFIIIIVELLVLSSIAVIIFRLTDGLVDSVNKVVDGMHEAQSGKKDATVEIDNNMPQEIETIAVGFNEMITKLEEANESERAALIKQKEAQIAALEAQINPHFLYNTLDTINWMAIDKDEYEISNAIGALAQILRYAISDSSITVPLSDEIVWLKKYIYLQQVRLKNKFICNIDVDPEAGNLKIHKLLLQPFVENSIIHGFDAGQEECILDIKIQVSDKITIIIADNGKGIDRELVQKINSLEILNEENSRHIGMVNAITRLRMYYGDEGKVTMQSEIGKGSTITISLPIKM